MSQRREILHFLAIETLKDKNDRRTRFKDGFGDFDFRPSNFYCTSCKCSISGSPSSRRQKLSSVPILPTSEPEEKQVIPQGRKQPLPFLQLPSEVRIKIYGYLLSPFRGSSQGNRIQFSLTNVSSSSPRRCHPFRNSYSITIPCFITPTTTSPPHLPPDKVLSNKHRHVPPSAYTTILSLSLTSHQLRAELGTLLFSETSISITNLEYLFLDFLADRPAIHSGIKKLSMTWDCHNEVAYLDRYLPDFCKFVGQHLRLEELELAIRIWERTARELVECGGKGILWVNCIKNIGVKRIVVIPLITSRCSRGDLDLGELTRGLEMVLCPPPLEVGKSQEQIYLETRDHYDSREAK